MKKILLLISLVFMASCGSSTPDASDAKEAARAAVLQNLKNPVDMTFHQNEIVKDVGNNTFEYRETINATNSFGGSIKQDAIVQVKFVGDDPSDVSSWSLLNIEFVTR
jgi:hypothetical protein